MKEIFWVKFKVTLVIGLGLVFLMALIKLILGYSEFLDRDKNQVTVNSSGWFVINSGIFLIGFILMEFTWDGVHPKTPPFSTSHLIWVNYKVVSQLSQPVFVSFLYLNSGRHNLVIELCRALNIYIFSRLFNKSTCSFVAIELLAFLKNEKFRFYWSRELSICGLKNNSLCKTDFFAFCVLNIKTSLKKGFLYVNVNINDSHQQKTMCTTLYVTRFFMNFFKLSFIYVGLYIGQKC